jgi:hypothetical protein
MLTEVIRVTKHGHVNELHLKKLNGADAGTFLLDVDEPLPSAGQGVELRFHLLSKEELKELREEEARDRADEATRAGAASAGQGGSVDDGRTDPAAPPKEQFAENDIRRHGAVASGGPDPVDRRSAELSNEERARADAKASSQDNAKTARK